MSKVESKRDNEKLSDIDQEKMYWLKVFHGELGYKPYWKRYQQEKAVSNLLLYIAIIIASIFILFGLVSAFI